MSKHNNVNPGQYKVAGREKMGKQQGTQDEPKQALSQSRKQERGRTKERPKRRTT